MAGHGDTEGHQYTPKLLERLSGKKVVQLSACGFHTGCLTDQGECFTWGEVGEETFILTFGCHKLIVRVCVSTRFLHSNSNYRVNSDDLVTAQNAIATHLV